MPLGDSLLGVHPHKSVHTHELPALSAGHHRGICMVLVLMVQAYTVYSLVTTDNASYSDASKLIASTQALLISHTALPMTLTLFWKAMAIIIKIILMYFLPCVY